MASIERGLFRPGAGTQLRDSATHIIIYLMTRLLLSGLFFLLPVCSISGQHLAAFEDNQNRFYIFDDGVVTQAEYLPVKSYSIGGACILYVDSRNHLKMYYNGSISTLEVNSVAAYQAFDFLAVYSFAGVVRIIENGAITTVSTNAVQYEAEDSLVAFYDRSRALLAVYYQNTVSALEDGIAGRSYSGLVCGDNIVAYVSSITDDLKAFYQGEVVVVEPYFSGTRYQAGKDILVYLNDSDQKLKVFYRRSVYELEDFAPVSFQAGDGIVAYIDHTGAFKIFSNGRITEISGFAPDFYRVYDRIVVFGEQGYFKAWYKDNVYNLENYIPSEWHAEWNSIVYRDINRNVKVFRDGKHEVLTYDLIEDIQLYRDIIVVNKGMNNYNVYYKDRRY
ncbi:MAG: hypothetical protein JXB19_10940 [Bacteroidales bacterium]|nr:hypothetical protein [Bacteroidales bacterium]